MTYLNEALLRGQDACRFWRILQPDIERMEQLLDAEPLPLDLSTKARTQLELQLLQRLIQIAEQPLEYLQKEIAAEENALAKFGLGLIPQEEREQSLEKLLKQAEQNPDFLASTLPKARSYMESAFRNYMSHIRLLFSRVAEHKTEIEAKLLGGGCITRITGISSSAGDMHNHGKTTALLYTDAGNFVYKPHVPGIDQLMEELVQGWFSDICRVPGVVAGDEYGFHEFVVTRPAATLEETAQYYTNLGGLCAVFQMLGSTDMHVENFLAEGSLPIPIDLETMLTPQLENLAGGQETAFSRDVQLSLLPSAIYPTLRDNTEFSTLLNTTDRNQAMPVVDGKRIDVTGYEEDFLRGFTDLYHRCMEHRQELEEFLHRFPAVPIRKLLHSTNLYANLLKKMYTYREKGKQEDISLLRQIMNLPEVSGGIQNYSLIAQCEAESMLDGDIPYFYTMSSRTDLMWNGKRVYPDYMQGSGVDNALTRLNRMNEAELAFEIRLFREALRKREVKIEPPHIGPRTLPAGADEKDWLAEAEQLFWKLDEDVVHSPGGGAGWVAYQATTGYVVPLGVGLGTGTSGILLFLAALSAETENPEIRVKARMYCDEILEQHALFCGSQEGASEKVAVDFMEGAAGILVALTYADAYLHDPRCGKLIQKIMQKLRNIPEGTFFRADYMTGVAGLVHVLCTLPGLQDCGLIARFADSLLAMQNLPCKLPFKIWDTIGKHRGISGTGHGLAGIGIALWSAYRVLEEEKYRQAALECFRWEHQIFHESLGTWPDLREIYAKPMAMHGFCSGAPGIGTALLSCTGLGENLDTYDEDLNRALKVCLQKQPLFRDHLCCGNAASIDFLLEYGRRLQSGEALSQAYDRMAECLETEADKGEFQLWGENLRPFFEPGMFFGISGIGYQLLRMRNPEKYSSVLLIG